MPIIVYVQFSFSLPLPSCHVLRQNMAAEGRSSCLELLISNGTRKTQSRFVFLHTSSTNTLILIHGYILGKMRRRRAHLHGAGVDAGCVVPMNKSTITFMKISKVIYQAK